MKILFIITKSNWGGAQKYVFELAVAAKKAGHDVQVACGGTGTYSADLGILALKLSAENIPVIHIKNFLRDMSPLNDLKAWLEIYKLIHYLKPDVVHSTSSKAGGLGSLAARFCFTKKIIFTSHGLTVDEVWRPTWQRVLIYISTWFTLVLAHKSIMISTETYRRAKSMPGLSHKVELIFNGLVPIDFLSSNEAKKNLSPTISPTDFWVGGIGELHPNKNWHSAILAMKKLPERVHLLIIGKGEEEARLKQLIADNELNGRVHLLGYLDGAKYLKAFDLFILPSKKEGLPYVLLEAGLASLPTIASDLPGNQDIIDDERTGWLIEPTPDKIAEIIKRATEDEKLRESFGKNLNQTIKTKFSIEQMYKKTLALYETKISSV